MKVKVFNPQGQLVGPVESARVVKTDAEWKAQLTAEQSEAVAKLRSVMNGDPRARLFGAATGAGTGAGEGGS